MAFSIVNGADNVPPDNTVTCTIDTTGGTFLVTADGRYAPLEGDSTEAFARALEALRAASQSHTEDKEQR